MISVDNFWQASLLQLRYRDDNLIYFTGKLGGQHDNNAAELFCTVRWFHRTGIAPKQDEFLMVLTGAALIFTHEISLKPDPLM